MEIYKDRKIETDEEVEFEDDDDDDKIKSKTRGLDNMIEDPDKITNL
jgi:hypothetical protein